MRIIKANTENKTVLATKWHHYVLAFFGGVFLVNMLPHYIHGITGQAFPTPFANPPGVGLSSPIINVLWATINFLIGLFLLFFVKVNQRKKTLWIAVILGGIVMSFYVAYYFGRL